MSSLFGEEPICSEESPDGEKVYIYLRVKDMLPCKCDVKEVQAMTRELRKNWSAFEQNLDFCANVVAFRLLKKDHASLRAIVGELAASDPYDDDELIEACKFCSSFKNMPHRADCLITRAREAMGNE